MYTVTTSAGLNHTFATVDQLGAALGQHLHDMATNESISWRITTPHGVEHPGFVQLPERRNDRLIADVIAVVIDDLRQPCLAVRTRARRAASLGSGADPTSVVVPLRRSARTRYFGSGFDGPDLAG